MSRSGYIDDIEDRGRLVVFLIPRPCECEAYPFAHYHEGSQSMREYDESCRRVAK